MSPAVQALADAVSPVAGDLLMISATGMAVWGVVGVVRWGWGFIQDVTSDYSGVASVRENADQAARDERRW